MPAFLLSHQGIVLPLKMRFPKRFDGTALCVGSFAPDVGFIVSNFQINYGTPYYLFHSIGGLVYTVPISLFLVLLFDRVFFPITAFLAKQERFTPLSQLLRFFGFDEYDILRNKKISAR